MGVGVSDLWAATKTFDLPNGYYYLGNEAGNNGVPQYDDSDFAANFYMCPAYSTTVDEQNYLGGDSEKPLITTFKSFSDNTNQGKTYSWAVWYIEAATGDNTGYFYIKHRDSDKYLIANDNNLPKASRRRVNLGPKSNPNEDCLFKIQSDDNGTTYYITSKTKFDGANKYLNPSSANIDNIAATDANDNTGGILGFWKEKTTNSAWHFVQVPCDIPVITYDKTNNKVIITSGTKGANIYYTLDETPPTSEKTAYGDPFEVTGPTTIKAIATKSGYADSEIASVRLVLNPTITLAQTEYTYSGSAIEPEVSSVMDGEDEIPASEYEISYGNNNINVGTVTINIVDKAGGAYIVYGSTTFTIVPAEVTLTANSGTETYDGTEKTVTGFTSSVDGLTFEGVSASGSGTNIGEYPVTFTGVTIGTTKDTSGNYVVTSTINGTLTISPKALSITADSETKVYDGTPLTKDAYTHTALLADDYIESVTITGSQTNAGTSNNVPSAAVIKNSTNDDVTANYEITYTNGTLEVTKKTLTVTADAKSKTYGEADPALTYTSEGLINSDAITGTLTREAGENAGVYAITLGGLTAGNNYAISYTGANLTITKVGLTATANNHTITYGAAPAGNGVTYEGFVNSETASVLGGTLDYDYSYTQFGDVGDYTITPKGLTSDNYDITFVKGKLTVNAKEVGIEWTNIALTYNGEEQVPTATATDLVNGDEIAVTVTGGKTNAGNYTATASSLTGDKAGNYKLPEANTQSFTISQKSIGNGSTIYAGYTLDFGEGNTILLTDEDIGRTMVITTDYDVSDDLGPTNDNYSLRNVVGKGNYTGSFDVRNVVISLTTDTDQEEWSATLAAENTEGFDIGIGLALPEGVSAFTISEIQGEWAIPEPLNYIPAGVPVLLVAHKPIYGFVPTIAESGNVPQNQKDRNMLEKVTESTADYDADTESAHFATKQIYLLYKNEFVFNKDGNLKKGKVYLNPNHTAPSAEPAPAHLKIAWNFTTGLEDGKWKTEDGRNERWYTLDGRRLSSKPTAKGLYIVNGKKVVIK